MSLYVYITRKPQPLEAPGPEISRAEWHALVKAQGDFRAPTPAELVDLVIQKSNAGK